MLVTEVNSQSWQISGCLPLLPDFYLHKIRMWHHPKKMCPHKISCWAKMHFPLVLLCVASFEEIKGKKKNLLCWAKIPSFMCRNTTGNFTCHNLPLTGQLKCPWWLKKESLMVEFPLSDKVFPVVVCLHKLSFSFLTLSSMLPLSFEIVSKVFFPFSSIKLLWMVLPSDFWC